MAVETLEIAGLGSQPAPLSYTVAQSQSFDLIGVRAIWDGTGAAGAFLPCVQIISSAGHVLAQSIGSTVAATNLADVTFAPFLRKSTTGGSGVTLIESLDGSVTVTNGAGPTTDLSVAALSSAQEQISGNLSVLSLGSGNIPLHHVSGSTLLNFTTPSQPSFINSGAYLITGTFLLGENFTPGKKLYVTISMSGGVPYSQQQVFQDAGSGQPIWQMAMAAKVTAGNSFTFGCANNDTVSHLFECDQVNVLKVS